MWATALFFASTVSAASILTPFNAIVSGNFGDTNNIDIGGGLAVGGAISFGSGANSLIDNSLNGELVSAFPLSTTSGGVSLGTTLIAVGGVSSGTAAVKAGNYYVTSGSVTISGGGGAATTDPVTFSTVFATFQGESSTIAGETQTPGDSVTMSGSQVVVHVNAQGLNIINLTADQLSSMNSINFVAGSGITFATTSTASGNSWVIINIAGTSDTINLSSGTSFNGSQQSGDNAYGAEDVLYNFYQATSLTLKGATVGSVLAPWAGVTGPGGGQQFDGSLVAASFTGGTNGTEFHNLTFLGPTLTPEPAAVACVGAGLIALAFFRKRRRS